MSAEYGGRSTAQEIDEGRCVGCGQLTDCGYLCVGCAFESTFVAARANRDDQRVGRIRAAAISRSWNEHRAAVHAQIRSMQSSSRDRARAARDLPNAEDQREIGAACERVTGKALLHTPWGFEHYSADDRRENRRAHRWRLFCAAWHDIGWQLLDDLTRPCQTNLPESPT
jgi:hypothetical protein